MKPLTQMTKKDIAQTKMIVFDVDGVLVPRGTKIKQEGDITTLQTKTIAEKQIAQIKKLNKKGFLININSGRGLYMLQEMFREILPFVSLTYENGSATWYRGKIYQHINSFKELKDVLPELKKIAFKNKNFKGFEPKEFIITIHCEKEIKEIEQTVKKYKNLTTIWNGEAYDIQIKNRQTKALGIRHVIKMFKLKKSNIMAIGDNYNDHEMLVESGTAISADKTRLKGDFYIPLEGEFLPADNLMQKILSLKNQFLVCKYNNRDVIINIMPSKKKGFTLIELLVVIAIIGILSAIVFTALNSSKDKANTASAMSIASGIMSYLTICSTEANGTISPPADSFAGGGVICTPGTANWPSLTKSGYAYAISEGNIADGTFDFTLTKDGQPTITCSLATNGCQKDSTVVSTEPECSNGLDDDKDGNEDNDGIDCNDADCHLNGIIDNECVSSWNDEANPPIMIKPPHGGL